MTNDGIIEKVTQSAHTLGVVQVIAMGVVALLGYLVYLYVKPTNSIHALEATLLAHVETTQQQKFALEKVVEFLYEGCRRGSKDQAQRDHCVTIYQR